MNFKYWVFLYIFVAGSFFSDLDAQDDQVVLHLDTPTDTRLAVVDFYPRSVATPETTQALSEFNEVLWEDLKFAGYFDLPSKSFYPENQTKTKISLDKEIIIELESNHLPHLRANLNSTLRLLQASYDTINSVKV